MYKQPPRLIVYIPTYNRSKSIKRALECITVALREVAADFVKVVISNNASEDDTIEICEKYTNSQIILETNKKNIGAILNIAKGLEINFGQEYTWIMGDDDFITPWALSKLFFYISELDKQKIDIKHICVNHLVVSHEMQSREDVFNLIAENKLTGFNWLLNQKFKQPIIIPFSEILDPHVDDLILGSITGSVFRTKIINDAMKEIDYSDVTNPEFNFENLTSRIWFPHAYAFIKSLSANDLCLSIPDVLSVAAVGHQEWMQDRTKVVAVAAFDSLFECLDRKVISNSEFDDYTKKFFLRHKHHFSFIVQNNSDLLSERKIKTLLKLYDWFLNNQNKAK